MSHENLYRDIQEDVNKVMGALGEIPFHVAPTH